MPVNSFENYYLSWKPDKRELTYPIFQSLAERLEEDIVSGILQPGTMLPPQRELADYLDIYFTTVTKAYNLCREKGLIYGVVGKGTFVSPHAMEILTIHDHSDEKDLIRMGYISSFEECNTVVSDAVRRVAEKYYLTDLLDYRYMQGHPHHIQAAQKWLEYRGIKVDKEHIGIVSGNMNGISICLATLFKPGDTIAVDAYTYPNFMELAKIFHIRLMPVVQDEEGMSAKHLETLCRQNEIHGIYLMPNFCNPTTICISRRRREQLADIIRRFHLTVIEDDIYSAGSLKDLPAMYTLIPEQTYYLSGTAKSISTGLRVSFVAFGEQFRVRIRHGIYNMNMKTSSLDVEIVADLIFTGDAQRLIERKNRLSREYNKTYDAIFSAKDHNTPNGLFRWLSISSSKSGKQIERELYAKGVDVCHSYRFKVNAREEKSFLRISLASAGSLEKMTEGCEIIKEYLREETKR